MKRPPKRVALPFLIWDAAWKFLAIRRAVQLKKWGWIPPLAIANTIGVLPIVFLLRNRDPEVVDSP